MKALLTGFRPLPGKVSPSMLIVNQLSGTRVGGLDVVGVELPEDFAVIPRLVEEAIEEERPGVAISIGWDKPAWIKVEKVAINVMSAHLGDRVIPDHEGNAPDGEAVVEDGPLAYASTLPANEIVRRIREAGIPSFVSYEAGTHVRNGVMYSMLHWTTVRRMNTIAGQIHVPPLRGMFGKGQPMMSLKKEVSAIRIAVQVCAAHAGSRGVRKR